MAAKHALDLLDLAFECLDSLGAPLLIPLGKAKEIEALVHRYGTLVRVCE